MKLGLDIHGVLDTNPKEFVSLAKRVRTEGGEVHIITGSSQNVDLVELLLSLDSGKKYWDYLVSIQDELLKKYKPTGINEHGRPYWPDELWDRFKGDYCAKHNIDLHYDDTERYIQYFTTPVVIYKGKDGIIRKIQGIQKQTTPG